MVVNEAVLVTWLIGEKKSVAFLMMVISFQLNSAQVRLFRAIIFLIFSNETLKAEASEKETKSQLQGALSH